MFVRHQTAWLINTIPTGALSALFALSHHIQSSIVSSDTLTVCLVKPSYRTP